MPEKAIRVRDSSLDDEVAFLEYGYQLCGKALPPVPAEALSAWGKYIKGRNFSRTMVALRWYLSGETLLRSAQFADLSGISRVCEAARLHGFTQFHSRSSASIEVNRQIAYTSAAELNQRLQDDPSKFSSKELGTISTRSLGVVTDHEANQKQSSSVFIEGLAAMAERFIAEGVELKMSFSVPKQLPEETEVIDVGQQAAGQEQPGQGASEGVLGAYGLD